MTKRKKRDGVICKECGEEKDQSEFVKDHRVASGYTQPCKVCKNKRNAAARLRLLGKPTPTFENIRNDPERKERGKRALEAQKVTLKRRAESPEEDLLAVSNRWFAKAAKAIRDGWRHVDLERYQRELANLQLQFPSRGLEGDARRSAHRMFVAACQGIVARYGG